MASIKPWLSFEEQLSRLESRGMVVEKHAAALAYLKRLGYYRLSGYWHPLRAVDEEASHIQGRVIRQDSFVAGSRFEDVVRLYVFDKKLRMLALDALERIEMAVRVDVAHLMGRLDPLAHERPQFLHGNFTKRPIPDGKPNAGKTPHQVRLARHEGLVQRARREPFVAHHLNAYESLPIWVAIELWDFGLLSKFFAGMKHADQQVIAIKYGAIDGRQFGQWLRGLNFIRNVAAHHSRLWNINALEAAAPPLQWHPALANTRPFFYVCVMQQLLGTICPNSRWGERFQRLLDEEFPAGPFDLADMGVLPNWKEWPMWVVT